MAERNEIAPPWVEYPGVEAGSMFWREGLGESFLFDVWYPYYNSLTEPEQDAYLKRWNVPEDWYVLRFDREFQAELHQIDKEYHRTHSVVPSRSTPKSDLRTVIGQGKYIHRLIKFLGLGNYEQ